MALLVYQIGSMCVYGNMTGLFVAIAVIIVAYCVYCIVRAVRKKDCNCSGCSDCSMRGKCDSAK